MKQIKPFMNIYDFLCKLDGSHRAHSETLELEDKPNIIGNLNDMLHEAYDSYEKNSS